MNNISIVTGAGTGIGRALTLELAQNHGLKVLAVGRRLQKLQETAIYYPERIKACPADVSNPEGREKILNSVPERYSVQFLVQNAGVLGPVKPLSDLSLEEWREHQAINVEGPLFLTQLLIPILKNGRVLHISSGAAHHAYEAWGAYCTSKAALHMLYLVFKEELKKYNISVGSVRPGVIDTPMQDEIRTVSEDIFPSVSKFIGLKEKNELVPPKETAKLLANLLLNTSNIEFSKDEWDLRDNPPK